jgi:S1-C subfamily serine protease
MLKAMSLMAGATILASTLAFTGGAAFAASSPGASIVQQEQDEKGVLIVSIERGGPAAKAGLKRGDIVLKVNDTDVNTAQELRDALAKLKPGEEAQLRVARGDSESTYKVTLGNRDNRAYLGVTPFAPIAAQVLPAPQPPAEQPKEQPEQAPAQPSLPEGAQTFEQLQAMIQTRVAEVVKDSPAEKAGLKQGDIIVAVDDTKLDAQNDLAKVIGDYKPGDKVMLSIQRDGEKKDIEIELGANKDNKDKPFLGIRYAPAIVVMTQDGKPLELPFELPKDFGGLIPMPNQTPGQTPRQLPGQGQGLPRQLPVEASVVIREVTKDSPAAKAGLQQGDVIVEFNGQTVNDPQAIVDLVGKSKVGDAVKLTVQREGEEQPVEIEVKLGENPNSKGKAFMGVALGAMFMMESGQGDGTQGFEIIPGFRLPFNFDFGDMIPAMPEQDGSQGSTL